MQLQQSNAAAQNGVPTFLLVSSIGANHKSFIFYPKIKGQLEEMVKAFSFSHLHIFRPPVLDRGAEIARSTEKKSIAFINKLNKYGILLSQKPMSTAFLAAKMIAISKKRISQQITTWEAKEIFNS